MTHAELWERHKAVMPDWLALYYEEPIEIVKGSGRRVTDGEGKEYIDFFAGILTNALGYDIAEISDAVREQLASGVAHTSTVYLIRRQIELAEKIAGLSGIKDAKVFFTNSGTEANEAAMLFATQKRRSNQVLAMRNSYHGRGFGTVAITGNRGWSASSLSPVNVQYVQGAYRYRSPFKDLPDAEYIKVCVDDLRNVIDTGTAGDVACLIVEPIQGVGGFSSPPDGMYAAFKEVLDEFGILLISDEVQTGWGRTGEHFWGIQAHDVVPDAMTFAKGLGNGFAIGGVVARPDLMDSLSANSLSTFGGNPISTSAAKATIEYLVDNDLQANAAKRGAQLMDGLRGISEEFPELGDVRGKGLMLAAEIVNPEDDKPDAATTAKLQQETKNRGLLIGKGGLYGNVLRMAPPMTLTEEETSEALEILRDSFNTLR
ncbi:4-aminobutyrate aminotransferase [Kribbella orskensis]|uniref:alanine--glyoxylate transaminase n=1 Tax=Kribbella orskensis TaxID=2512216 RepID=A0ABY2BGA8_9ACTN|nr:MULTISPECIES: aspartate aminotransferase family protein [Kribbella]TCN37670.1 4-aminobutyrate aminotransferase [Kribbella sp. VKM Ac-2500]TCO18828.1 4-aminobutyrate aminotransferase [Kribbella orskensis]